MRPSSTTTRSTKDPRRHLVPIESGPWLDDMSHTRACRNMVLGGSLTCVASVLISNAPNSVKGFWLFLCLGGATVAFFGALGYGAGLLARRAFQTCPACLGGMSRGATTCPHCHYQPQQEPRCNV